MKQLLSAITLAAIALAEGSCDGEATGSPLPQCDAASAEQVGTWTNIDLPAGIYLPGNPATSNGASLIVGETSCQECMLFQLEPDGMSWSTSTGVHETTHLSLQYTAGADHLLALGEPIEILDQRTGDWSVIEQPANLRGIDAVHAAGQRFILWGGRDTEDPNLTPQEIAEDPNTPWVWFYDGHLLDAVTGEWTAIPPAREDARYLMSDGGPSLPSVWTSAGLFVWGTNPERTATWGAIFDVESMEWTLLDTGAGTPPLRQNHRLLAVGNEVFLFGGVTPGSTQPWRTVWRYSLSEGGWSEIEDVPTWADPLVGTEVDGRIAFMGRCVGGELYDPVADTWSPLSTENAPPSDGVPRGAGSFLTVTDTYYGEQETNAVWVLDLSGSSP